MRISKNDTRNRWQTALNSTSGKYDLPKDRAYIVLHAKVRIPKHLQKIPLSGKSLWGNISGISKVTSVELDFHISNGDVESVSPYFMVTAKHNRKWEIYTDQTFEKNLSKVLSEVFKAHIVVSFTEQGMQENYRASLETPSGATPGNLVLMNYVLCKNNF